MGNLVQTPVALSFVGNMQTLVTLIFLTRRIKLLRSTAGKQAAIRQDNSDTKMFNHHKHPRLT
ncbi:MAG: hypothetical protein A2342_05940 [Gallionellales bacterium RIFOXYB12_FULL_54_9]|nr:MAG: hypothetical protein A2342_05940 [Gallionellales bacterium RIFOXYB12_FULL_54_9]